MRNPIFLAWANFLAAAAVDNFDNLRRLFLIARRSRRIQNFYDSKLRALRALRGEICLS